MATGAAVSSSPTWLLEGFADYVALADVDLPVSLSASQILGEVSARAGPRATCRVRPSSIRPTLTSARPTSRRGWQAG